jgi:predicted lipoprotein with Yx(FWY)xxD motif
MILTAIIAFTAVRGWCRPAQVPLSGTPANAAARRRSQHPPFQQHPIHGSAAAGKGTSPARHSRRTLPHVGGLERDGEHGNSSRRVARYRRAAWLSGERRPRIEITVIKSKRLPLYVAGGGGLSALAVLLGLTVSHSEAKGAGLSTSPQSTVVMTRETKLGQILVDAQGRTLYLFAKDTGPASTCDGSCASSWPPVPASGQPHAAGNATASSLGVITRPGGHRQLSYAGHPLYYFVRDSKVGQTRGQGLDQFGAEWYVLNSAGAAVVSASSKPGDTGTGGGGGY